MKKNSKNALILAANCFFCLFGLWAFELFPQLLKLYSFAFNKGPYWSYVFYRVWLLLPVLLYFFMPVLFIYIWATNKIDSELRAIFITMHLHISIGLTLLTLLMLFTAILGFGMGVLGLPIITLPMIYMLFYYSRKIYLKLEDIKLRKMFGIYILVILAVCHINQIKTLEDCSKWNRSPYTDGECTSMLPPAKLGTLDYCRRLDDFKARDQCLDDRALELHERAVKRKDYKICSKINFVHDGQSKCLHDVAIARLDKEMCESLKYSDKQTCLQEVRNLDHDRRAIEKERGQILQIEKQELRLPPDAQALDVKLK